MSDQVFEKRGNKAIIHVNVYPAKDCAAFSYKTGYIAIAKEMTSCWSHAETMDETINKFKTEYAGMLTLQFQSGEQFEFEFAVKLKA